MSAPKHRPDPEELDRCVCGAEIVYFEFSSFFVPDPGCGCDVLGRPTVAFNAFRED